MRLSPVTLPASSRSSLLSLQGFTSRHERGHAGAGRECRWRQGALVSSACAADVLQGGAHRHERGRADLQSECAGVHYIGPVEQHRLCAAVALQGGPHHHERGRAGTVTNCELHHRGPHTLSVCDAITLQGGAHHHERGRAGARVGRHPRPHGQVRSHVTAESTALIAGEACPAQVLRSTVAQDVSRLVLVLHPHLIRYCALQLGLVSRNVTVWQPRERYRKASELSRVRGKLSCLLINDLDAGLGHFEHTQVTVNNQASCRRAVKSLC